MNYMKKEKTNESVAGRKTKYSIPDVMGKGMHVVMTTTRRVASISSESPDQDDDEWAGLDDEMDFDFDDSDAGNGNLDELVWD
jgi:hypothetical protein